MKLWKKQKQGNSKKKKKDQWLPEVEGREMNRQSTEEF